MKKLLLSTLLMSLCLSAQAAAETYKCIVGGKVRYTNQNPGANDKCTEVFTRKLPAKASVAETAEGQPIKATTEAAVSKSQSEKTLADKALENRLKKTNAEDAKNKEEVKQAEQQAKQQNCQTAKLNVETLKVGRVTRLNEKGEKYFLDNAEIAKELEQASKEVEKWCGE